MGISHYFSLENVIILREYEIGNSLGEFQGIRCVCIELLIAISVKSDAD